MLINYFIIHEDILYLYDSETVTYKKIKKSHDTYLLTIVRKSIVTSFQNLDDKGKRFIRKMYIDKIGGYDCEKLFQLEFSRDIIYDVIELLTHNLLPFNQPSDNETHYKNGILNT